MIAKRQDRLNQPPKEVTLDEIPLHLPKAEFDEKWMYIPLKISGIFDHTKETKVSRTRHEERGYEIITPMFTSVDKKTGQMSGIFVNRGRIPMEYKDYNMHQNTGKGSVEVEGVLMYSEE